MEKFKILLRDYGLVAVGVELTLYAIGFVAIFTLLQNGVDVKAILDFFKLNSDSEVSNCN
jgi:hypothetical protein